MSNAPKRTAAAWLLPILLVAFALRAHNLDAQSFHWDEAKSVLRASQAIAGLFNDTIAAGDQVPLHYLLLKPWMAIGQSEFIVRYFSVIVGTVTVSMIYVLGRRVTGATAGFLAAVLTALSPIHIWYSQEARMYVLLVLLLLAAHCFLLGAIGTRHRRTDWLAYTLAMIAAVYTHYFALLVLLAHYIFFALQFRRRRQDFMWWFASAIVVGLALLPWILFAYSRGGFGDAVPHWIEPVGLRDLLYTLSAFTTGWATDRSALVPYAALTLYLLGLVVAFIGLRRTNSERQRRRARLLFLWFIVPLLLTFLISASWFGAAGPQFSLYMDRYLLTALPAYLILVAWGFQELLHRLGSRWPALILLVLVIGGALPSLSNVYGDPSHWRTDWRGLYQQIASIGQPGDVLLLRDDHFVPFEYYGHNDALPILEIPLAPGAPEQQEPFEQEMSARLQLAESQGAQRAWLIANVYPSNTHHFVRERNRMIAGDEPIDAQQKWMNENFRRLDLWRFTGTQLALYDLTRDAAHGP